MNMFALASLGPTLESALGRSRYLALYLLSALGGSTLSFLLSAPGQLGVGCVRSDLRAVGAFYVVVRGSEARTRQIVTLIGLNIAITIAIPILGLASPHRRSDHRRTGGGGVGVRPEGARARRCRRPRARPSWWCRRTGRRAQGRSRPADYTDVNHRSQGDPPCVTP
jgi:hypothetical protein